MKFVIMFQAFYKDSYQVIWLFNNAKKLKRKFLTVEFSIKQTIKYLMCNNSV